MTSQHEEILDKWYKGFIDRCNRRTLDTKSETIVFFLDEGKNIIGHHHCKDGNPDEPMSAMKDAKEHGAVSVFVGRNVPAGETFVIDNVLSEEVAQFRAAGDEVLLPVHCFMLLNRKQFASINRIGIYK